MTADDNDIGHTAGRTVTFESLGQGAVISGFIVLILAILPLPVPWLTLVLSVGACTLGAYVLKRGAAYGGITAAFGLVGTVLAVFALPIAGFSVATAPEPPDEVVTTPAPDSESYPAEEPAPSPENSVEPSATPDTIRLDVASVTATSTADSAQDAGGSTVTFDADNVADNDPETAWRTPGTGIGESLTFTFSRPVHLTSVGVIPGYAKLDPTSGVNRFTENRRVEQARFDFGGGIVNDYSFSDSTESQTYTIEMITDSVTVTILDSTDKTKRNYTALSEIAFYGWVN
ncbi:MAG TPA: hypothetical protein VN408_00275 [Actinoplanes sp.]|nr:hypothetical protein [Actinoplanes sp.]